MTRLPLAIALPLALLLLALPTIALAGVLGPLNVPHITQFGPSADAHYNDCGCASAVGIILAYTGEAITVDQCCYEVGTCRYGTSLYGDILPFLASHGVPSTWRMRASQSTQQSILATRPYITMIQTGHNHWGAVTVVGTSDKWALVHFPWHKEGPEWVSWQWLLGVQQPYGMLVVPEE